MIDSRAFSAKLSGWWRGGRRLSVVAIAVTILVLHGQCVKTRILCNTLMMSTHAMLVNLR